MPLVDLDDPTDLRARWSALAAIAHATGYDRAWWADQRGWHYEDATGNDLRMAVLDADRSVVFGYHRDYSETAAARADLLGGAPEWIAQPEVRHRISSGELGFVYGQFSGTWARAGYPGDPWQPIDDGFLAVADWLVSDHDAAAEMVDWVAGWTDFLGATEPAMPAGLELIRAAGTGGITPDHLLDLFELLGVGPESPRHPDLAAGMRAAALFGGPAASAAPSGPRVEEQWAEVPALARLGLVDLDPEDEEEYQQPYPEYPEQPVEPERPVIQGYEDLYADPAPAQQYQPPEPVEPAPAWSPFAPQPAGSAPPEPEYEDEPEYDEPAAHQQPEPEPEPSPEPEPQPVAGPLPEPVVEAPPPRIEPEPAPQPPAGVPEKAPQPPPVVQTPPPVPTAPVPVARQPEPTKPTKPAKPAKPAKQPKPAEPERQPVANGLVFPSFLPTEPEPAKEAPPGSLEAAMRAAVERDRERPGRTPAQEALHEWCLARTRVVPSGFTIQVQALDPAALAWTFDLDPPPVPGLDQIGGLLRDLWDAEADTERGGWLFARIDAAGRTLRIDRWYDQIPAWWDGDLVEAVDIPGLIRRLGDRAPRWRPPYLERMPANAS